MGLFSRKKKRENKDSSQTVNMTTVNNLARIDNESNNVSKSLLSENFAKKMAEALRDPTTETNKVFSSQNVLTKDSQSSTAPVNKSHGAPPNKVDRRKEEIYYAFIFATVAATAVYIVFAFSLLIIIIAAIFSISLVTRIPQIVDIMMAAESAVREVLVS